MEVLKNWEEADAAGARVLAIEAKLEQLEGQRKELKQAIDKDIAGQTGPLKEEQAELLDRLHPWVTGHPKEWDEGLKQRTLESCVLTVRQTEGFKYPKPLTKLLDKLKELKMKKYIRVKEELNKEAIEQAPDKDLVKMGVGKEIITTIFVKPKV